MLSSLRSGVISCDPETRPGLFFFVTRFSKKAFWLLGIRCDKWLGEPFSGSPSRRSIAFLRRQKIYVSGSLRRKHPSGPPLPAILPGVFDKTGSWRIPIGAKSGYFSETGLKLPPLKTRCPLSVSSDHNKTCNRCGHTGEEAE
jgi:hypothetical protein